MAVLLEPRHLRMVRDILSRNVPDADVWVYGSRATGRAKPWSDLDLAILAADGKALGFSCIGKLEEDFEESDLPFRVQTADLAVVSLAFREAIEKDFAPIADGAEHKRHRDNQERHT